jgi:hypothetical protein
MTEKFDRKDNLLDYRLNKARNQGNKKAAVRNGG